MIPENIELDLPLVTSGKISTNSFTLAGTFNKTIQNSSVNDINGGGTISAGRRQMVRHGLLLVLVIQVQL